MEMMWRIKCNRASSSDSIDVLFSILNYCSWSLQEASLNANGFRWHNKKCFPPSDESIHDRTQSIQCPLIFIRRTSSNITLNASYRQTTSSSPVDPISASHPHTTIIKLHLSLSLSLACSYFTRLIPSFFACQSSRPSYRFVMIRDTQ